MAAMADHHVGAASIRPMALADYDAVLHLMQHTPGVVVREADSREGNTRYLQRNPGLSFVAVATDRIVGCAMCGHDGRRGYLQHVLVLPDYRQQGIARELVQHCLDELTQQGIYKCHLDVLADNLTAQDYWTHLGWKVRTDIRRYSFIMQGGENS